MLEFAASAVLEAPRRLATDEEASMTPYELTPWNIDGKRAGVYAIFISATPIVYVGQSTDIIKRWRKHQVRWVWPNAAEYHLIKEMPNSTCRARNRTEAALIRLLRRRGHFVLSEDHRTCARRGGEARTITWTPDQRAAVYAKRTPDQNAMTAAREALSHADYVRIGKLGGAASLAAYPVEARTARLKQYLATLSPEQLAERRRRAIIASQKAPNSGRFRRGESRTARQARLRAEHGL